MAVLKIGKFEIAQQSGSAGTIQNGVKYAVEHTGRAPHQKQARGYCGTASQTLDLSITGKAPFMTLASNSQDIAWDTTTATVTVTTNAEKFRVSSGGKTITLQSSAAYTVNGLIGTFSNNLGMDSQHDAVLAFGFGTNTTSGTVSIPILIEYYDGSTYKTAGTFTVNQSSADADFVITSNPATLNQFANTASSQTVAITSNKNYTIEKQGGDISWFTISRTTGTPGTANLKVDVVAQAVAAPARSGSIIFKNPISGSTVLTLAVTQAAGVPYSITITPNTVTFANNELNVIKNVEIVANAAWQLEEVIN